MLTDTYLVEKSTRISLPACTYHLNESPGDLDGVLPAFRVNLGIQFQQVEDCLQGAGIKLEGREGGK